MNKRSGRKKSTFGVAPKKLAELLRISSESDDSQAELTEDQKKAQLLLDRLAEPLLLDPSVVKMLPSIPSLLSSAMELCDGESIGQILMDPGTDISVLRKIKGFNNKASRRTDCPIECDTAIAVYYAAIASALVFHNKRISRFGYEELEKSFAQLADKPWMDPSIVELFGRAGQVCQDPSSERQTVTDPRGRV